MQISQKLLIRPVLLVLTFLLASVATAQESVSAPTHDKPSREVGDKHASLHHDRLHFFATVGYMSATGQLVPRFNASQASGQQGYSSAVRVSWRMVERSRFNLALDGGIATFQFNRSNQSQYAFTFNNQTVYNPHLGLSLAAGSEHSFLQFYLLMAAGMAFNQQQWNQITANQFSGLGVFNAPISMLVAPMFKVNIAELTFMIGYDFQFLGDLAALKKDPMSGVLAIPRLAYEF